MDRTDLKTFVTEIKMIGRRKEFKGVIKGFKTIEDVKDTYDYLIINVCKKYRLDTNVIVESMEKIWANAQMSNYEETIKSLKKYAKIGALSPKLGSGLLLGVPFLVNLGITYGLIELLAVGKIPVVKILVMNKYMKELQEYVISFAENQTEKNG